MTLLQTHQKGISLIMAVFIMATLLAMSLGLLTILIRQQTILQTVSHSSLAFYTADAGIEKTRHLRFVAGDICSICGVCPDCINCVTTPLSIGGCGPGQCNNCRITYEGNFENRAYTVSATINPFLCITAEGKYQEVQRVVTLCP